MHGVAPACETENVCPATVSVPLRVLALVFAVTYQVTVPPPVPLAGENVSQLGALLDGVHVQPALADTLNVPLPDAAPALTLTGQSEYVQGGGAPACETENVCPATVNVPLRGLVLVLGVVYQVTVPLPVPLAGENVSQAGALLDGVHAQPVPAVTLKVPLPDTAPELALTGQSEYVQVGGAPACVTENVCPPIVIVPKRGLVPVFAVTYQFTVPLPFPLAGEQVSQPGALLEAVQLQEPLVVTEKEPLVDPKPGFALVAERP